MDISSAYLFRDAESEDDRDIVIQLNRECFPDDEALSFEDDVRASILYWLAKPIGFCAWYGLDNEEKAGFLYRAGILENWRGKGLQKAMIDRREKEMRAKGLKLSVTFTNNENAPSMRNLISMGYRPFAPDELTTLSGWDAEGRMCYVHWKKNL